MSRSLKVTLASMLFLAVVSTGVLWFSPKGSTQAHAGTSSGSKKLSSSYTQAMGPYSVQGNKILASNSQPYLFHGIGRDSLEYTCTGDGHFSTQELAYMGPGTNSPGNTYWDANTVRLPLTEGYWVNPYAPKNCTPATYQAFIKQTVDTLTAMH